MYRTMGDLLADATIGNVAGLIATKATGFAQERRRGSPS